MQEEMLPSHLVVQELSKKYDSFVALAPTNFELMGGEISILSGPNGSGKTTLLSCLTGLVPLSSGSVQVMGYDLYRDEVEVRHRMIYVPDVPRFYLELTAWEHLRFMALANGVEKDFEQKAERLMKKYGIWEAKDLFPHHYSRGMRLKLGLALALIRPFDVLLLDEPTSALDEEGVRMLVEELRGLRNAGAAILLTTHDPGLIDQLADRRLLIRNGEIRPV
jgi:ABC-2 type transport system ATP-binding protein